MSQDEDEEVSGAFLTSLSLQEPELDLDPVVLGAPEGEGDEEDEVAQFLSSQGRRRRELEGYVSQVQSRPHVSFPTDFLDTVQTLVATNVAKKTDFLRDLQKLSSRLTKDHGSGVLGQDKDKDGDRPWETDAKIDAGLDKIKKLDEKLNSVEAKLKILAEEMSLQDASSKSNKGSRRSKTKSSSSENEGIEKGGKDEGGPTNSTVARHKRRFLEDTKLQRVLRGEGLSGHMKRNAELLEGSRFFTLTEEDAKLVEEVMARSEDTMDEEDPYSAVLMPFANEEEEEQDGNGNGNANGNGNGGEGEGKLSSEDSSLSSMSSLSSKRMLEIDSKLEEYSQAGSMPPTPSSSSLQGIHLGEDGKGSTSPDSVISHRSVTSTTSSVVREARELKQLFRMERDIDAKIAQLRQSELALVPREAIELLLQNYYNTSVPDTESEMESGSGNATSSPGLVSC